MGFTVSDTNSYGVLLFTVLTAYWATTSRTRKRKIRLFVGCMSIAIFITAAANIVASHLPQKQEAVTFSDEHRGWSDDGFYHTEITVHVNSPTPGGVLTVYAIGKHLNLRPGIVVNPLIQGWELVEPQTSGMFIQNFIDDDHEHYMPVKIYAARKDYRLKFASRTDTKIRFRGEFD